MQSGPLESRGVKLFCFGLSILYVINRLNSGIRNSLRIRFWKFCWIFKNACVAPICVGATLSESPNMFILLGWSFSYIELGVLIWFRFNPRNLNPRNYQFLVSFSFETIFPLSPSATILVSKDVKFSGASSSLYKKFNRRRPLTQTPTQKFKIGFWILNSKAISSSLVSFGMILKLYNESDSDSSFIR